MQVILLDKVANLGNLGDVVKVPRCTPCYAPGDSRVRNQTR
jgi:hypothetical protein